MVVFYQKNRIPDRSVETGPGLGNTIIRSAACPPGKYHSYQVVYALYWNNRPILVWNFTIKRMHFFCLNVSLVLANICILQIPPQRGEVCICQWVGTAQSQYCQQTLIWRFQFEFPGAAWAHSLRKQWVDTSGVCDSRSAFMYTIYY